MRRREFCARLLRQACRVAAEDGAAATAASGRQAGSGLRPLARTFASQAPSSPSTRGPVSYLSLGLTMATGAGVAYWFIQERDKKLAKAMTDRAVVVGQATIGGPFKLIDTAGKPFSDENLKGTFTMLYFGFTHCPDICPEELEKVVAAVNIAGEKTGAKTGIVPVFITVDPERDGPKQVEAYVKEFHPRMIGLTGSPEAVRDAAKAYRVYYTKAGLGEGAEEKKELGPEDDYLVDHSIITYLLDPEGKFVTFYGRNYTETEMAASIVSHVDAWKITHRDWMGSLPKI